LLRIPGSNVTTKASTFDRQAQDDGVKAVADWYPEEHGPIPPIIRFGRKLFKADGTWDGKEGIRACGQCHLATGSGRGENAQPAGLPVAYILLQMEDFRNGLRASADPKKDNTHRMISFAKLLTPEETRASAEYFAAQPFPQMMKVIESTTAPKTRPGGGLFHPLEGPAAGLEPLGQRIVEIPEDEDRNALRDPKSGYIAYVPVGSIKKGEALVARGQCESCHGRNLRGEAPGAPRLNSGSLVPALAGRSPTYIARQLFDFQVGVRQGAMSGFMRPVLADLSPVDMLNISAYIATLVPPPVPAASVTQTASR
jgi:cytochrome c553